MKAYEKERNRLQQESQDFPESRLISSLDKIDFKDVKNRLHHKYSVEQIEFCDRNFKNFKTNQVVKETLKTNSKEVFAIRWKAYMANQENKTKNKVVHQSPGKSSDSDGGGEMEIKKRKKRGLGL